MFTWRYDTTRRIESNEHSGLTSDFYNLFFSSELIGIIVMDAPSPFARIHVLRDQTGFWILPSPQDGRRKPAIA